MVNKNQVREYYLKELEKMFSNDDIDRWLGAGHIIKYSELDNYETINDLLPNDKDFKVILIESSYNSGHWIAVMKYGNIIEYFNSYGTKPGYDFKFIPTAVRNALGQGGNLLSNLLKTKSKGQKVYYNKKKLQKISDQINTCGRHVIARILAMKIGYELDDYINKIETKMEETGKPSDILICDWIK